MPVDEESRMVYVWERGSRGSFRRYAVLTVLSVYCTVCGAAVTVLRRSRLENSHVLLARLP